MNLFIQTVINSIVQILLFSLIPFIWWLITQRKKVNFFQWLGLKQISDSRQNKTIIWTLGSTLIFLILSVFMLYTVRDVETATSSFSGLGFRALPSILVYAIFNTSLSEEIIFRGFLLKRLANRFGFLIANVTQSLFFALLHGMMFFSLTGIIETILIIIFTGGIGFCMGYVNEKCANGSILPSWCTHAVANIFSGLCSAFMLF